ncbi:cohesin domain-containing protein, partial [uncultured Ruminococcus sp.]|uniref:cohesin domain-containing protein n=1 Tax=uncultured Ruminococcus sp. TaxID=165186 RepID=UPI002614DB27
MKKLLSAVTSIAMSFTLMAGAFASSVSAAGSISAEQPNVSMGEVLDVSANRTAADGKVEWLIPTVTAAPGQTVTMPVVVKSSSLAVAGAQFKISAADVTFGSKTDGDAYGASIAYNKGKFAFGQGAGRGIVAADDSVVVTLAYTVPANAAPGTKYPVQWADQFVSDTDGNDITEKVTFTNGEIVVKDAEANGNIEWVLDKVTAAPGEVVTVKATVSAPDNATLPVAGAQFKIDNDSHVNYSSMTEGGAYASSFAVNNDKKSFAFGNGTGAGVVAADGATIASFKFQVPSDCGEGVYPVKWADGFVCDTDGKDLTANVKFTDGSITVKKNVVVEGKVKWVLDNVTAQKGETVTLKAVVDDSAKAAVPVAGAQFKINADTVKYSKIADGTAYGAPITANDAKQSFAFGNVSGAGVAAADGSQIFTLTYTVPADCADGKYPVKWSDAFVSDTDGRDITSNVIFVDGSITVGKTTDGTAEWVIPKVQAERGQTVTLDVLVKGDSDLEVAGAQFGIKGTAPTKYSTAAGTPYGTDLVKNDDKMSFAFAQASGIGKGAYDGDKIMTLTFTVPTDCPKGQYPVKWTNQFVSDTNGGDITDKVTFTDGWIEVVDVVTTTTPGPTTTTTTTTVTAPEGGIIWQIATVTAYPGETVKLPIKVVDMDNSRLAIAGAQFDIKNRDGVNYFAIEGSDAYGASIVANALKKKFDFANTVGVQVAANDGDNVAILTYNVPEGTQPGTYPVEFVKGSLMIFDTDGNDITDKLIGVNGAIIVALPDVTSTTTTTSTTTSGPIDPNSSTTTTTTSGPIDPNSSTTTSTTSGPIDPNSSTTTS